MMANIRVDVGYAIHDGSELKFRSPVDCSAITGLIVHYPGEDGILTSQAFVFADAHGNNVGVIDHLFAENVVVKVILDVTTSMAFVQNADTNAYLEGRFSYLKNQIDQMEQQGVTDESVANAVKNYMQANPISESDPTVPQWAKEKEKPAYTASEVGARPSDWMPTAIDVGARPNTWLPTLTEIGAVSTAYGLPTTVNPTNNNLDDTRTNGWYSCSANTVGMPTGLKYIEYGAVLVINRYGNDTTQLYVSQPGTCAGAPYLLIRNYNKTNGAWNPWEWINPPMALSTEYRTIKRWNGKPVYVKAVDVGSLPNNSSKTVAHGITGNTEFVSVRLCATSGSGGFELVNGGVSSVYVIGENVQISTGFDASAYSGKAIIEYTKS